MGHHKKGQGKPVRATRAFPPPLLADGVYKPLCLDTQAPSACVHSAALWPCGGSSRCAPTGCLPCTVCQLTDQAHSVPAAVPKQQQCEVAQAGSLCSTAFAENSVLSLRPMSTMPTFHRLITAPPLSAMDLLSELLLSTSTELPELD